MKKQEFLCAFVVAFFLSIYSGCGIAQTPPSRPAPSIDEIQLESGLTLRDWIDSSPVQQMLDPLAIGGEAKRLIARYGAQRALVGVLQKASQHDSFSADRITPENAAASYAQLRRALQVLGEWPDLLFAQAKAASLAGNISEAHELLKRWMRVAPATHPQRKTIAGALIEAQGGDYIRFAEVFQSDSFSTKSPVPNRANTERSNLTPVRTVEQEAGNPMAKPIQAEADFSGLWASKVTVCEAVNLSSPIEGQFQLRRVNGKNYTISGELDKNAFIFKGAFLRINIDGQNVEMVTQIGTDNYWLWIGRIISGNEMNGRVFDGRDGTFCNWNAQRRSVN